MQHTNRLIAETSPYLLQHAHNPVDWYPWGKEALEKAKAEDKPILVSIGYSSCHWCHVMEKESFEDVATAELMNRYFVNIKIDREERPDLDHIYMDAVTAMTGSGGWPLNVFLTPDLKPFYGGTYFPPERIYNRPSWKEVLMGIATAFRDRRDEIEKQATELTRHLENANAFGSDVKLEASFITEPSLTEQQLQTVFQSIMKSADRQWGGFGRAPKFPQTFTIRFLLHYAHAKGNEEALQQACLSLDRMMYGGIYDHIGGGFARYSTDNEWLVPHFEKMLYDNALLVGALSEAYQLTGYPRYALVIHETLAFIEREMTSPKGGFYAALDADSEGVEGKYYVWTLDEIKAILGNDAALFAEYYGVTKAGNWEHTNILWIKEPAPTFCANRNLDEQAFSVLMRRCLQQLKAERDKRIRPLLDDKIILGWNALMNTAYAMAFAATGVEAYRQMAVKNMQFMLKHFAKPDGTFHHVYKAGHARFPAFLDDLTALADALIHLQEITSEGGYLQQAYSIMQQVEAMFKDEASPFYFYTPDGQTDIVVRKKEVYDGAIPSGNALACQNFLYLGTVFDDRKMIQQGVQMLSAMEHALMRYPGSFGIWARIFLSMAEGSREIAIVGKDFAAARDALLRTYIPNRILQAAPLPNDEFPLLKGKNAQNDETYFYLCRQYACSQPVQDVQQLLALLRNNSANTIK